MGLLSLVPLPAEGLPQPGSAELAALVDDATKLIAGIPSWPKGKAFNAGELATQTYSVLSPSGSGDVGAYRWHARVSRHKASDLKWDDFRRALHEDHSIQEKEYIGDCIEAKEVEVLQPGLAAVFRMSYKVAFPASKRDFVELVVTPPASSITPRSFQVISIPVVHPSAPVRPGFVRARYTSVEQITEGEDGTVTWVMATASNAAGAIPRWITEKAMPSTVCLDVPALIAYLKRPSRP